jgi:hypothetical protein
MVIRKKNSLFFSLLAVNFGSRPRGTCPRDPRSAVNAALSPACGGCCRVFRAQRISCSRPMLPFHIDDIVRAYSRSALDKGRAYQREEPRAGWWAAAPTAARSSGLFAVTSAFHTISRSPSPPGAKYQATPSFDLSAGSHYSTLWGPYAKGRWLPLPRSTDLFGPASCARENRSATQRTPFQLSDDLAPGFACGLLSCSEPTSDGGVGGGSRTSGLVRDRTTRGGSGLCRSGGGRDAYAGTV